MSRSPSPSTSQVRLSHSHEHEVFSDDDAPEVEFASGSDEDITSEPNSPPHQMRRVTAMNSTRSTSSNETCTDGNPSSRSAVSKAVCSLATKAASLFEKVSVRSPAEEDSSLDPSSESDDDTLASGNTVINSSNNNATQTHVKTTFARPSDSPLRAKINPSKNTIHPTKPAHPHTLMGSLRLLMTQIRIAYMRNPSFRLLDGSARQSLGGLFLGCVLGMTFQNILTQLYINYYATAAATPTPTPTSTTSSSSSLLHFAFSAVSSGQSLQLSTFLFILAMFHTLEYFVTAIFHPDKLSFTSYLLNHSREYHIAMFCGFCEFMLECYFIPQFKYPFSSWIFYLGVLLSLIGQLIRSLAMLTAGSNFTHLVADQKERDHELVTHGIYSICRHPSYSGWFMWSVGTQILLGNPLCTVAYAFASWHFFKHRIRYEESRMIIFFGDAYRKYQKEVPTGVPFVFTESF